MTKKIYFQSHVVTMGASFTWKASIDSLFVTIVKRLVEKLWKILFKISKQLENRLAVISIEENVVI